MIARTYLVKGLNALSRAHETNYFTDGHRGGAMVSAWFFCREDCCEKGSDQIIAAMLDAHWAQTDLCAAFPNEKPLPEATDRIVAAMRTRLAGLRQAGHNVILPTLALKALRASPEAATPRRVEGICRLASAFEQVDDLELTETDPIPDIADPSAFAEFVLEELRATMSAFIGRGQGWSGHLLTYARALLDLREMGLDDLADEARAGFALYLKRIRMGPLETDSVYDEHPDIQWRPHQHEYWRHRQNKGVGIGHVFKYPYGFYGLLQQVEDPVLRKQCLKEAFRIF